MYRSFQMNGLHRLNKEAKVYSAILVKYLHAWGMPVDLVKRFILCETPLNKILLSRYQLSENMMCKQKILEWKISFAHILRKESILIPPHPPLFFSLSAKGIWSLKKTCVKPGCKVVLPPQTRPRLLSFESQDPRVKVLVSLKSAGCPSV